MTDDGPRESFAAYRARLDAVGFRPSKRFGQNFLLEPTLHRAVADAAGLACGDVALEIGAGLGFLTRTLASRAVHVVAVEIDARLARILREDLGAPDSRIELIECDALAKDDRLALPVEAALVRAREAYPGARLVVASNLPYAVAGPLLVALAVRGAADAVAGIGALVQLELAERFAARPGTSEYGSLPALLQALYQVRIDRRVGREVFRPRPNVDSAIVSFRARVDRAPSLAGGPARAAFARFVRELFAARRKTLRHALDRLAPGWATHGAVATGFGSRRAEQLDPNELVALFETLSSLGLASSSGGV